GAVTATGARQRIAAARRRRRSTPADGHARGGAGDVADLARRRTRTAAHPALVGGTTALGLRAGTLLRRRIGVAFLTVRTCPGAGRTAGRAAEGGELAGGDTQLRRHIVLLGPCPELIGHGLPRGHRLLRAACLVTDVVESQRLAGETDAARGWI